MCRGSLSWLIQLARCCLANYGFLISAPCASAPLTFLCIDPGLFEELVELRFMRTGGKNRIVLSIQGFCLNLIFSLTWLIGGIQERHDLLFFIKQYFNEYGHVFRERTIWN